MGGMYMSNFKRVLLENCIEADKLEIELGVLNYDFIYKPLLIGGKAKEYYGIRDAGDDIDFVISEEDYEQLAYKYPDNCKDLCGDLGVCRDSFEIWKSIFLFDYEFLSEEAIETEDFFIISFEKLMFLTVLAISQPKYLKDTYLLRDRISVINTLIQDYY
jgi:hypothetical protein